MTKEKLSQFNEKFYEINASIRNKVCDTLGQFMRTKDEKILTENLTFTLGSDYYHEMADLCFEIIKALKVELTVQLPTEFDDED